MEVATTNDAAYREYTVLSEDRRSAVDIFVKAVLLASAFLSVAFTVMLTSKTRLEAVAAGLAGLVLLLFFLEVARRCRQHDEKLHENLEVLREKLDFYPVIPTRYVFNTVLIFGGLIFVTWLVIWGFKIADPARGLPWPNPLTINPSDGN